MQAYGLVDNDDIPTFLATSLCLLWQIFSLRAAGHTLQCGFLSLFNGKFITAVPMSGFCAEALHGMTGRGCGTLVSSIARI